MSGSYPNLLAGGVANVAAFLPFELWAGERDLVTSQGTAAAIILQFQVIARDGANKIIPWDGAAGKPIGFAAQAAVVNGPVAYYVGGVPNHLALVWPVAIDTLDKRKAAFDGTGITISALL